MKIRGSVTGNLVVHRDKPHEQKCRCCEPKPHAWSYWAVVPSRAKHNPNRATIADWLHDQLGEWVHDPDTEDEAEVVVTVEIKRKKK